MAKKTIWDEGWLVDESSITYNSTENKVMALVCENYIRYDRAPTTRRKIQHDILNVSNRMINKSIRRLWQRGYLQIYSHSMFGGQKDLITPTYKAISWWNSLYSGLKINRKAYAFY